MFNVVVVCKCSLSSIFPSHQFNFLFQWWCVHNRKLVSWHYTGRTSQQTQREIWGYWSTISYI